MLHLITGIPGHGKTLFTLDHVEQLKKQKDKDGNELPDRPVYYHNINELKLDWTHFDSPDTWYELPYNSIIVIDEAQEFFPVRTGKDKVPLKCSKFERHRHTGWDIFLITQHPMFLDVHVRRLAGDHKHIERKFGTQKATIYSHEKAFDPEDYHAKKSSIKKLWTYPKKHFESYTSATQHTVKRNLPKWLLFIPLIILALGGSIYMFTSAMGGVGSPIEGTETPTTDTLQQAFLPSSSSKPRLTFAEEMLAEIPNVPQSAPFYKELYKAKSYPKPQCITNEARNKCFCNTQQGTRMNVTLKYCLHVVDHGIFDPTIPDKNDNNKKRRGEG